ncbi:uncharacterized protein BDR25DRAFT_204684, partial [Lindgomyces ingoldianus]
LDTCLLLVILGLLLLLLVRNPKGHSPSGSSQLGEDFTSNGPEFATRIIKWESDMSFVPTNTSEFLTDEVLARWNTIMPARTGFGPPGQAFSTTSMTHQLHCVYMLGRTYSGIISGKTQDLPQDYHAHFFHCIDYLRQAVMCSADLALELHKVTDADDLGAGDGGWSGRHVCKDYSQVISYLERQISDGVRIVLPIDD